jgi:hypothetical protein
MSTGDDLRVAQERLRIELAAAGMMPPVGTAAERVARAIEALIDAKLKALHK